MGTDHKNRSKVTHEKAEYKKLSADHAEKYFKRKISVLNSYRPYTKKGDQQKGRIRRIFRIKHRKLILRLPVV